MKDEGEGLFMELKHFWILVVVGMVFPFINVDDARALIDHEKRIRFRAIRVTRIVEVVEAEGQYAVDRRWLETFDNDGDGYIGQGELKALTQAYNPDAVLSEVPVAVEKMAMAKEADPEPVKKTVMKEKKKEKKKGWFS